MKILLVVILLELVSVNQTSHASNWKPKISIYFESLCMGCNRFITEIIHHVYEEIGSYFEMDLVPYGDTQRYKKESAWVFQCQHGKLQCLLNKLEACGLAKTKDQAKKIEFINCVESNSHVGDLIDKKQVFECAKTLGAKAKQVLECTQGSEGDELLAKFGDRTDDLNPPHYYLPWIMLDDKFDQYVSNALWNNFTKTVCSLLPKIHKPEVCYWFREC